MLAEGLEEPLIEGLEADPDVEETAETEDLDKPLIEALDIDPDAEKTPEDVPGACEGLLNPEFENSLVDERPEIVLGAGAPLLGEELEDSIEVNLEIDEVRGSNVDRSLAEKLEPGPGTEAALEIVLEAGESLNDEGLEEPLIKRLETDESIKKNVLRAGKRLSVEELKGLIVVKLDMGPDTEGAFEIVLESEFPLLNEGSEGPFPEALVIDEAPGASVGRLGIKGNPENVGPPTLNEAMDEPLIATPEADEALEANGDVDKITALGIVPEIKAIVEGEPKAEETSDAELIEKLDISEMSGPVVETGPDGGCKTEFVEVPIDDELAAESSPDTRPVGNLEVRKTIEEFP